MNRDHSDHFRAAVVEHIRHPPSKRNNAGGNPAGSALIFARWCQSSMAVCYTVRCWCESNSGSQLEGRQALARGHKAGCTCFENSIRLLRRSELTDAFRHFEII